MMAEALENLEDLEFEVALSRLEEIVAELEEGELALEEALEKFKTGMALKELCERKLTEAEAQIEEYVAEEGSEQEAEPLFE